MKKQTNLVLAGSIIGISIALMLFVVFEYRWAGTKPPENNVDNPITFVESMFRGIDRTPELSSTIKKAELDPNKPSDQTLVTANNQNDLDKFIKSNNLDESEIHKSNSLPNTYIVYKPKDQLNADSVSLAERKKYSSLYNFMTQDAIYPQWYTTSIRADDYWAESTGSTSTTVAVIDTGFALNHEDLDGRWAAGGHDFYNNDNDPSAGTTNPNGGAVSHGTMVAGLIGATGDNGVGVASVNWKTKILPLQVLSDSGSGWTDDVAAAIDYAVEHGADVINMSLGSSGEDPILKTAIDSAVDAGVTIVAAAGNCGASNYAYQGCSYQGEILYPGKYDNVISVGATDSSNNRADFSSYGPEIDITAPGYGAIRSSMWTSANRISAYNSVLAGTSFASPIVAGIAALQIGDNPSLSPSQIKNRLIASANKVAGMGGNFFTDYYGYGLVDVYKGFHQASCTNDVNDVGDSRQQILSEKQNAKKQTSLWYIQRNNTDSFCEELKAWNSSYSNWRHNVVTNVPTIESTSEKMLFADIDGNGATELIRIKYNDISGKVKLYFWDSTLQAWAKQVTTNLDNLDMIHGDVQAVDTNGDGKDELFYIKYNNTSSGKVQFYKWNNDYSGWSKKYVSLLSARSLSNGTIISADTNGDKKDQFYFVKYNKSKRVEIYGFSDSLKSWTLKKSTNLTPINPATGLVITSDTNGDQKDEFLFVDKENPGSNIIIYEWNSLFTKWSSKKTTNLPKF